jgi:Protein of unknown function (DUF2695)
MDTQTLLALADYLNAQISVDDNLNVTGCDNTLSKSIAWLRARRRNVKQDVAWLKARGSYCDCEVLLNVVATIEREN